MLSYLQTLSCILLKIVIKPMRARALALFTPVHYWEGGTQIGPHTPHFGEVHFMLFFHDVGEKQLIGRLRAMH